MLAQLNVYHNIYVPREFYIDLVNYMSTTYMYLYDAIQSKKIAQPLLALLCQCIYLGGAINVLYRPLGAS